MARRRRAARRTGGGRRRKRSIVGTGRGLVYVAIPAVQTFNSYNTLKAAGRNDKDAITQAVALWGGISPTTKTFDSGALLQQYTPIGVWMAADWVLAKVGVWSRMGRLLR